MVLNTSELFMSGKQIRGFNLHKFLRDDVNDQRRKEFFKEIQDDINLGGKTFGTTKIGKEMGLHEWNTALDQVEEVEGTIVLKCF